MPNEIYLDIESVAIPERTEEFKIEFPKTDPEKQALYPDYAQLACICAMCDEDEFRVGAWIKGGEAELLQTFWAWVKAIKVELKMVFPMLVTFNGKDFDYPFIIRRSMYHRVKPTMHWDTLPYRTENHRDVRLELAFGDKRMKGRFEQLIRWLFGHELETDKSLIGKWWVAKEYDKILELCWQDVVWLKQLSERMEGYYW